VCPFALAAEEAEYLDCCVTGAGEAVGYPGVEFGRFSGRQFQVLVAQQKP
jgi:hypothetical protein